MKKAIIFITLATGFILAGNFNEVFANWNKVPAENRGRPILRNYHYREYKGHNQVWAVTQDNRGIMYFGNTDFGILEYDGVNWKTIPVSNRSAARSLDSDGKGTIWVGAINELGYLERVRGERRYVSLVEHIPKQHRNFKDVYDTLATRNGVYFRTRKAIFRWWNREMAVILPETEFGHRTRKVHGKVYAYQKHLGLYRIDGDGLIKTPGGDLFSDGTVNVMLPFSGGRMLAVSVTRGAYLFDGREFKPFPNDVGDFLTENWVYSGATLRGGLYALGTSRGVAVIDEKGKLRHFLDKNIGLIDHDTLYIFADRQAGIWLAFNNGIARVNIPDAISEYNELHGISSGINSVTMHRGKLYIATAIELLRESSDPPHPEETFEELPGESMEYWKLLALGEHLLVGTSNGVFLLGEDRLGEKLSKGVSLEMISSTVYPGRIYVGLLHGVTVLEHENGRWKEPVKTGGIDAHVWTLAEDSEGALWAGTLVSGVLRIVFEDGDPNKPSVTKLAAGEGLPEGSIAVSHISGRVRAATREGLFAYDPEKKRFERDRSFGEMFADPLMFFNQPLIEDSEGIVWITYGMEKKLAMACPKIDGSFSLDERTFSTLTGVAVDSIHVEEDGVAWIGGPEGLFRYDPDVFKNYNADFNTIIRNVKSGRTRLYGEGAHLMEEDDVAVLDEKSAVLPFEKNDLRFEFAATNFINESSNRFQFVLEGYKDDRGDAGWTETNFVEKTNLPEGKYLFKVMARNIYGHVGRQDFFEFVILPPWYRTWWAYGTYVLLVLLICAGAALEYGRRIKRKAEIELRKKEEELTIKQQFLEATRRFVPSEFLRYLNRPSIIEVMLGDCAYKNMSVLFSDLRSFTTMSETMSPENNFKFLNSYLGTMSPVIRENNGFIDKYIGDAIMALFDRESDDAVIAAITMLKRLREFNRNLNEHEKVKIGIGIHTGPMMMGTIGEPHRMETTVISDVVNLASRLEGMTKMYGLDFLISGQAYENLKDPSGFSIREIDKVTAKGKNKPVIIYEVYDSDLPEIIELKNSISETFKDGLSLYRKGEFRDGEARFKEILSEFPDDKVSQIYLHRCRHHEVDDDWDGVTKLDIK